MMCSKSLSEFFRNRRGVAATEFALVLPVLVLLALAAYEVPRALILYQKLNRVTFEIGDLVARQPVGISKDQLQDLFTGADKIMEPFDFKPGAVVISSITRAQNAPAKIAWQCISTNSIAATSKIGGAGDTPTLPANFVINAGDNVIVAEVRYEYAPVFGNAVWSGAEYYDIAYFRPRGNILGALSGGNC